MLRKIKDDFQSFFCVCRIFLPNGTAYYLDVDSQQWREDEQQATKFDERNNASRVLQNLTKRSGNDYHVVQVTQTVEVHTIC